MIGFGSSNYGNSLADFEDGWVRRVSNKTTIIILGDARGNRTDPRIEIIAATVARAKRVIWLNPEYRSAWGTGDSDMFRYRPFCHVVTVCNTLRHLERVVTRYAEGRSVTNRCGSQPFGPPGRRRGHRWRNPTTGGTMGRLADRPGNVRHHTSPSPRPAHGLGHAGDVHADAGLHHRQRRAAVYAGQHVGLLRRDHLGADVLRDRRRHHDRAGRLAGRPLRPQAAVHDLHHRLHCRLHAVRRGADAAANGGFPPAAGHVRRGTGAAVAGDDARHLPLLAPRPGDGDLLHGRHDGTDDGPDARRLPDRSLLLALGVLRKPAVRHHGD